MVIYLHKDGKCSNPLTLEKIQSQKNTEKLTLSSPAWFKVCANQITVNRNPLFYVS
jgi:hypothetical protein